MQSLTGKIYALTSFFSQSDSVFLVKKILFADGADLFRMPLRMRNNDTMNVRFFNYQSQENKSEIQS